MAFRNAEQILKDWEKATKENPFYLHSEESDAFREAMRIWGGISSSDSNSIIIHDRDISFKDGSIFSHADGKRYSNRKDWDNHLKQHGCFEVGNDKGHENRKKEIRGEFNCRKELTQAVKQTLGSY